MWVHDDGELDMWCKVRVEPEEPIHSDYREEARVQLPRMEFVDNLFYTPGRIVDPEIPEARTLHYTQEYMNELMYRGLLTPIMVAQMHHNEKDVGQ